MKYEDAPWRKRWDAYIKQHKIKIEELQGVFR